MRGIAEKSIGFMVDELVSTCLKLHHFSQNPATDEIVLEELTKRKEALSAAIEERIQKVAQKSQPVGELIAELTATLIQCWQAQEAVMSETVERRVARAAKDAQQLNAKRNKLIREIDSYLGEAAISVTGKTYG